LGEVEWDEKKDDREGDAQRHVLVAQAERVKTKEASDAKVLIGRGGERGGREEEAMAAIDAKASPASLRACVCVCLCVCMCMHVRLLGMTGV
jgi:hypothetical protein